MTLKRQGAIQTYAPVAKRLKSLDTRVRKLQRVVDTKPEWFHNVRATTTLATGAIYALEINGANSLSGAKILSLECVVDSTGIVDVYLIQNKLGTPPVYADFINSSTGSPINQGEGEANHCWRHVIVPSDGPKVARFRIKFPMGFYCDRDSSGNNTGKALYLVIKNESGSTVTYAMHATGYSVDNDR